MTRTNAWAAILLLVSIPFPQGSVLVHASSSVSDKGLSNFDGVCTRKRGVRSHHVLSDNFWQFKPMPASGKLEEIVQVVTGGPGGRGMHQLCSGLSAHLISKMYGKSDRKMLSVLTHTPNI